MNLSRRISILILILSCVTGEAEAFTVNTTPLSKTRKDIEDLGTGVAIALPVIAGGITLYKHDPKGSLQLVVETALVTKY